MIAIIKWNSRYNAREWVTMAGALVGTCLMCCAGYLGWGEIIGSILLLIPRTAARGAWILAGTFVLAIIVHLLHAMTNVGNLAIYTAAAWAIAMGKGNESVS